MTTQSHQAAALHIPCAGQAEALTAPVPPRGAGSCGGGECFDEDDTQEVFVRIGKFLGLPVVVEAGDEPADPHCVSGATVAATTVRLRR